MFISFQNFEKIFHGQNESITENYEKEVEGCFKAASRHIRKRKCSTTEVPSKKKTVSASFESDCSQSRSFLCPLGPNQGSYDQNQEMLLKKRVKFDEKNLIATNHRCKHAQVRRLAELSTTTKKVGEKSVFARFLNFTANLF